MPVDQKLWRHVEACNNLPSPAGLIPFRIGEAQVGWVEPDLAQALTFRPRDFHFDERGVALAGRLRSPGARSQALADALPALATGGFLRIRGELFDVRQTSTGPALATLDRGAVPRFGVMSQGVHVNGIVRRADGPWLWVGFRAKDKAVAPGQMDNVIAGGIPAGLSAEETLVKEAGEEAKVPPELAVTAKPVGRVSYILANDEGLRRDVLHCFDLELPEGFTPTPNDDEVERFELWPAVRVLEAVRETDEVKFNVNLTLLDFFVRWGLVPDPGGVLRRALDQGPD